MISSKRFYFYKTPWDLEQDLMAVWGTKDDIDRFLKVYVDGDGISWTEDAVHNHIQALADIHEIRCQVMWETFEGMCKAYGALKRGEDISDKQGEYEMSIDEMYERAREMAKDHADNKVKAKVKVSGVPYAVDLECDEDDLINALQARVRELEQALKDQTEAAAKIAETEGLGPVTMPSNGLSIRDRIAKKIRDMQETD